jgi:hypothetical protein
MGLHRVEITEFSHVSFPEPGTHGPWLEVIRAGRCAEAESRGTEACETLYSIHKR